MAWTSPDPPAPGHGRVNRFSAGRHRVRRGARVHLVHPGHHPPLASPGKGYGGGRTGPGAYGCVASGACCGAGAAVLLGGVDVVGVDSWLCGADRVVGVPEGDSVVRWVSGAESCSSCEDVELVVPSVPVVASLPLFSPEEDDVPRKSVGRPEPVTDVPPTSSGRVRAAAATTKATIPVTSPTFHQVRTEGRRRYTR